MIYRPIHILLWFFLDYYYDEYYLVNRRGMNGDVDPVADKAGDPGVHDYEWIESHRVTEHHPTPTTGELLGLVGIHA